MGSSRINTPPTARVALLLTLFGILVACASRVRADEPRLSDAEVGQLRHFITLAQQDPDDWTGWEAENQRNMEAYRYQIAFMSYALALQQYHSLPAWRELYRHTQARLILRMLQKPVWEYWEVVSRGMPKHDPDFEGPGPGWRDPVREKNVMYSGHVAHMAALYEMLYRDLRWDERGTLTFRWDADEAYVYDLPMLIRLLHDQMANNPWGGIECEINAVFPECNQHPILAMELYDRLHGTKYFEARHRFHDLFERAPMIDPETHEVVAYYRVKQGDVLSNRHPRVGLPNDLFVWPMVKLGLMSFDSPSACGWTGAFMHAWDPKLVESNYPFQKAHHVEKETDDQLRPDRDHTPELSVGYFATLAIEVGDADTARGLLAWADAHYGPVSENGELRYPRHREGKYRTSNLTGKLIALARSNRPNGIWQMHNRPWSDDDFAYPLLEGVDFPRVIVRQAFWDPTPGKLVVAIEPGSGPVETSFRLVQLDPSHSWELTRDGAVLARVSGGQATEAHDARVVDPGTLEVTTMLTAPQRFELKREEGTRQISRDAP